VAPEVPDLCAGPQHATGSSAEQRVLSAPVQAAAVARVSELLQLLPQRAEPVSVLPLVLAAAAPR